MSRFLLKSPLGSQRTQAQECHGTSSEIHDCSFNALESSCSAGNETGMDLNSSFHIKQAPMLAEEHTSGWPRSYVNGPLVSQGSMSAGSLPSWETTEKGIVPTKENAMPGQADVIMGSSSFSHDTCSQMRAADGLHREIIGNSTTDSLEGAEIPNGNTDDILISLPVEPQQNCILNRFEAIRRARDSYNCTGPQPSRDSEVSLNSSESCGSVSITSSRGSSKRKICAIGNSSSGTSSKVSAYTCSYTGASDPGMLGMDGTGGHRRNGPTSTCLDSELGETSEARVDAAHAQQGEWFLNENLNPYEEIRGDPFLRTSTSGEGERRLRADVDAGYFSMATDEVVSGSDRPQVQHGTAYSQPDLRISRRMHSEAHRSAYPSNVDLTDFLRSPSQSSEGHGGSSFTNLSSRRENGSRQIETHRASHVYEDGFHQNPLDAFRGGQSRFTSSGRFPSSSAYEVIRPEALSRISSSMNDLSETFNLLDPHFPATSITPAPGLSEYSTRSRSRTPSSHSRHVTSFLSATSFPPPVSSSAIMEPSSIPSHSVVSPPPERPPSSSRVLRRLMLSRQSLLDAFGERSLLSAAGDVIAFPLHRLGALRFGEDPQHRILNDVINEQMLMLEATILFGGVGIQDEHNDWRLDVDNMSYEELLALGEQIGEVCTGLSEEVILQKLKTWKYVQHNDPNTISTLQESEVKCCVCQEEYESGEELGGLACGHSYHAACIKQWLVHKNLCPVCKVAGLS